MISFVKRRLYFLKVGFRSIFSYPQNKIGSEVVDYDAYWDKKRGDSIGVLSDWQKSRADIILSILGHREAFSIADIGCGDGSILKYLVDRLPISHAIGYDTSEKALNKARQLGIEVVKIDITRKEDWEKIESVDYALLLEVLEHIPESEKLLSEIYKKVNKGVFFSVPNSGYITYRLRMLLGKMPAQWTVRPGEHLRFWTLTDMKWWLKALGYNTDQVFTYRGVPLLNKIIPSAFSAGILTYLGKK